MIDLQNYLHHRNLCHVATKNVTKTLTEKQVKNYKRVKTQKI